ncbi:MAG: hypothetical protein QOI16_3702 [Pseudonocardiales bacterium]|jgi:hypothetical protein|nr:hypothetical protein [Pseudonocardiales bacterium]
MATATAQAVDDLVRATRARMPELLERIQKRIRAEIPFYAGEDVVGSDELRSSLRDNVDYILAGVAGGRADLDTPKATGQARAAQGAPMPEMLAAYRLGFSEVWRTLVETARLVPGIAPDALVDLAGAIFALHDEYCSAAMAGYRDESRQILRATEREHAALVEAILTGTPSPGTLWEAAQALRLPLEGVFLVVAAEALDVGHDPLPRIQSSAAVLDVGSVWRLQPDLLVGVLSLRRRERVGDVLELLGRHATGRVGVSPVVAELRQAAWALRLARLALANQPVGTGVGQFAEGPLSLLVAAAPHAAMEAARSVLEGILELPDDDRDLLLGTFSAWLDADGSATDAAAALFCHPNTVRYRLRRIEERTHRSLGRPSDVAELVTAVRAWSQLPHPD